MSRLVIYFKVAFNILRPLTEMLIIPCSLVTQYCVIELGQSWIR